jgi:hypothetical protein
MPKGPRWEKRPSPLKREPYKKGGAQKAVAETIALMTGVALTSCLPLRLKRAQDAISMVQIGPQVCAIEEPRRPQSPPSLLLFHPGECGNVLGGDMITDAPLLFQRS